ncbi:MAG: hypothetical protein WD120_00235, partial [Gemmatimonadota bacterium]
MTRANIAARRSALVAARIMIVMAVLAISLTALPSGISAQGRTPEVAGRSSVQVPSPAEVLGYEIGERFTPVSGIERYLRTLADSSELVSLDTYGETVEGRPLLQAVVALPRY